MDIEMVLSGLVPGRRVPMKIASLRRPGAMSRFGFYIDGRSKYGPSRRMFGGTRTAAFGGAPEMAGAVPKTPGEIFFPKETFEGGSLGAAKRGRLSKGARDSRMEQKTGVHEHEKKTTFIIHVRFRQNSTWQGEIRWVGQDKVRCFRSGLEMIKLMDRAAAEELGSEGEPKWE